MIVTRHPLRQWIFKAATIIVLFCQQASAQQFEARMSPVFKTPPGMASSLPVDNGYLALELDYKSGGFGYTFNLRKAVMSVKIVRFDSSMKSIQEYALSGGEKVYGPMAPQLKRFGNKIYLIYYTYNADIRSLKLFLANVNPETLVPDAAIELMEVGQANTGLFKSEKFLESITLTAETSPDHQHLLVAWSSDLDSRFYAAVLDNDLKLTWKNQVEAIKQDRIYEFDACVDNKGVVYASYRYTNAADPQGWTYKVTAINPSGKIKEEEIKTSDSKVYQVMVIPSQSSDQIHVVGTYSQHPNMLNGVYSKTLSTTDYTLQEGSQTAFTEAFIEQMAGQGWASKREKSYGIKDLRMAGYELADGSIALVGEWRSEVWGEKISSSISGSLLNVRIKDKKVWVAANPKYRSSQLVVAGDSYAAIPYGNNLLIFYNDNPENLKRDPMQPASTSNKYWNSVLAVGYLDSEGVIKRQMVLNNDDDLVPYGDMIRQVSDNEYLVPMIKVKRLTGNVGGEARWGVVRVR